ncbi:hypothetical protein THAOC_20418 [Thalassiosira oceanica]|uniref:Uncharacterized protein n=1 Tax=Thalassiosira oceanica TaxID=159749 RepID=K0SLK8_THAOC|nr:hypothetical protein THAOC_20418 [Thalassiosira oceanica]|eukprot:EJK59377.1 hypothetical protein THAOC_20418 [Thalassiosira oceanica]
MLRHRCFAVAALAAVISRCTHAFSQPQTLDVNRRRSPRRAAVLAAVDDSDSKTDSKTTVGSSEYYQGFISRSVDEEPAERVTGDAVLGPTLKFAGGVSLGLIALTVAFLASNGLI